MHTISQIIRSLAALSLFISLMLIESYAQPRLEIAPNRIIFKDLFHRLGNVIFANTGNQTLTIDSIRYKRNLYYVRFDNAGWYPFSIAPGDSVEMDCILAGYYALTQADSSDTMYIFNNGVNSVAAVNIEINNYPLFNKGAIDGRVMDGIVPVIGAKIYFFYEGNNIIDTVSTDSFGGFSAELPEGVYTVGAESDQHYFGFYDRQFDPFSAKFVQVNKDSVSSIEISLTKKLNTGYSVAGKILDSMSLAPLRKGIIIVRKGSHNPAKRFSSFTKKLLPDEIYTTTADYAGSYEITGITTPDFYYVQSFSDYYLPAYYSSSFQAPTFWKQADSLLITSNLVNKNIYMLRDSSFGWGTVSGTVNTLNGNGSSTIDEEILVYTNALASNSLFNYAYSKANGEFRVTNLPFGTYQLLAEKIGFDRALGPVVVIDSNSVRIDGIEILFRLSSVGDENSVPDELKLYQNYPNPFNPSTNIEFYIPSETNASVSIINILGEEIVNLYTGFLQKGRYSLKFHADGLPSGAYFIRLKTDYKQLIGKIMLIK